MRSRQAEVSKLKVGFQPLASLEVWSRHCCSQAMCPLVKFISNHHGESCRLSPRHRLHAIAGGTQYNVVAACFARCIVAARSSQFRFARPLVPSAARAERRLLSSRGISAMASVMGGHGGAIAHHARHTQWCYCCHNSLKQPMTHPCDCYIYLHLP